MKKKIVALLLVLSLFGTVYSVSAADISELDRAAEAMLTFTKQERADMLTLIAPMLIRDSGLDSLIEVIERYEPGASGLLGPYLEYALRYTDKETLKKTVNSLRLIDPYVREDSIKKFLNREEKALSSAEKNAFDSLLEKTYSKAPNLKVLCEQDGITSGVLAGLMQAFYETNGKQRLFYYDGSQFTLCHLDSAISGKIREVWGIDGKAWIKNVLRELNDRDTVEKNQLFEVMSAVNMAEKYNSKPLVNNSGSGVPVPSVPAGENKYVMRYHTVEDTQGLFDMDVGSFTVIRADITDENGKAVSNPPKVMFCLELAVTEPKAEIYRLDKERITPVPFSVCEGGKMTVLVDQTGYYGIKINPEHFMDMQGQWGQRYVESLYQRGIINGKEDYAFAPEEPVTREEFVKLIVAAFGLEDETASVSFEDAARDEWYYKYIASAYKKGIVKGIDAAHFGVGQQITREDMVTMISNMLNAEGISLDEISFFDAQDISGYAFEAVKLSKSLGFVSGDERGYFRPQDNATRQEAAKIIYMMIRSYVFGGIILKG